MFPCKNLLKNQQMNKVYTQKLLILRKKVQPPKWSNSLSLQNELFEAQKGPEHTHGSDAQFCLQYACKDV